MKLNLENLTPQKKISKPRIVLYGPNGIGKSTFASQAPDPLFIDIEKNLESISCLTHRDIEGNFDTLLEFFNFLKTLKETSDLPFKTLILDSIYTFEDRIIRPHICYEEGVVCVEDIQWGRGSAKLSQWWSQVFKALEDLSHTKNLTIILIGHDCLDERIDVERNLSYPYQRPLIHKKSIQMLLNWSTCILYANYGFKLEDRSQDNSLGIPKERGGRLLYATPDAGYIAKNNYGILKPLPLNFQAFYEKVSQFYNEEKKGN